VVVTSDDPARLRSQLGHGAHGADVRQRDEVLDVQRELAAIEGVTVLAHDPECAAESAASAAAARRRRRPIGRSSTSGCARGAVTAGLSPTACRCTPVDRVRPQDRDQPVILQPGLLLELVACERKAHGT
jgi:hypothetical protein